ncbi:hypothetical protein ONS96_006904 [Cadophora gregata f. sp. sojae]|nr:hypothetical protein ONS96_006904 [Cadophora gregata f. sp. sojae]
MVYDETSGELRESHLDLNNCLVIQASTHGLGLHAQESPEDPNLDHITEINLSKTLSNAEGRYSIIDGTAVFRYERTASNFLDSDDDMRVDLNQHLWKTPSGHFDFVHPAYHDDRPRWLQLFSGLDGALGMAAGRNGFETAVDLAVKEVNDSFNSRDDKDRVKQWMKNTYVYEGRLIRHGT